MNTGKVGEERISESEEAPEASSESMEALLAQQDSLAEKLSGRKVTWVKIIQVTKEAVLVDIGEKREGVVALSEFAKDEAPAVGQRIPVIMTGAARGQGPSLSYRRARAEIGWETAKKAFAEKARVRGQVLSAIKGGFMVDVSGVSAFLPASLADLRPVRTPAKMVGTGVRCYILEMNEAKHQLVLSRKAVLEEEAAKRRTQLLAELRVGEVRIGRIVHAAAEGLIVDIGGAEGLVRSADVAWGKPKEGSKLERGEKIKVKVLGKGGEGERIALGIKQLVPNPADAVRKKFPLKTIVRGKLLEATPAGLKIKLDGGAPAFAPISECEGAEKLKAGDALSAIVQGVDNDTFDVLVSINRYNDIQDRKRMAQYLKAPPPLTLGQLLSPEKTQE